MASKPFVRILDLTGGLAGHGLVQWLEHYDVEVLALQLPADAGATSAPVVSGQISDLATSAMHAVSSRAVWRRIAVDYTYPEGQDIVREIAAQSQLLVVSSSQAIGAYGLSHDALCTVNPSLVYGELVDSSTTVEPIAGLCELHEALSTQGRTGRGCWLCFDEADVAASVGLPLVAQTLHSLWKRADQVGATHRATATRPNSADTNAVLKQHLRFTDTQIDSLRRAEVI